MLRESRKLSDGFEVGPLDENPEILLGVIESLDRMLGEIRTSTLDVLKRKADLLRSVLDVRSGTGLSHDVNFVLAVDSTWSKPPLELVIGLLAVIVTGHVVAGPGTSGSHGIDYVSVRRSSGEDEDLFNLSVEAEAKVQEYLAVVKGLDTYRYLDLVMIDGPLFAFALRPEFYSPSKCLDVLTCKEYMTARQLVSLASSTLLQALKRVDEEGLICVGVVKRVSSRFLLPAALQTNDRGLADVVRKTNDKFVMSYLLKPGEYVVLGTQLDLLDRYLKASELQHTSKLRDVLDRCINENEPLCTYMKETAIIFYRPPSDALFPQAVRIDVYPKNRVEEVVDFVMENTSQNSVPTPIDYVDRYVRLESRTMRRMYLLLQSRLISQEELTAFGLTDPQKSYIYLQETGL